MTDEEKKKQDLERRNRLIKTLVGTGLTGLGLYGATKIPIGHEQQIFQKVKEEAERRGIEVRPTPSILSRIRHGTFDFSPAQLIREPTAEEKGLTPDALKAVEEGEMYPYGLEDVKWKDILGKAIAWSPKEPSILAHEMGHEMQRPMGSLSGNLLRAAPTAAMAAGLLGASLTKDPRTAELAGLTGATVGGLAALPLIGREMSANYNALKVMREAGATKGQLAATIGLRMLPRTVLDVATFGAPAAISYFVSRAIANRLRRKQDEQKKEAGLTAGVIGSGLAVLLGGAAAGAAIYDSIKAESFPTFHTEYLKGEGKEQVDTKKQVKILLKEQPLRKPPVVVTSVADLKPLFDAVELSEPAQENLIAYIKSVKAFESSPAAIHFKNGIDALLLPPKMALAVLKHEIGHIRDLQSKKDPGAPGLIEALAQPLWWPTYDKYVYDPEVSAWEHAKARSTPTAEAALGTYEGGFHRDRSGILGGLGAALLFGGGVGLAASLRPKTPWSIDGNKPVFGGR